MYKLIRNNKKEAYSNLLKFVEQAKNLNLKYAECVELCEWTQMLNLEYVDIAASYDIVSEMVSVLVKPSRFGSEDKLTVMSLKQFLTRLRKSSSLKSFERYQEFVWLGDENE